jgi:hypothetical protein
MMSDDQLHILEQMSHNFVVGHWQFCRIVKACCVFFILILGAIAQHCISLAFCFSTFLLLHIEVIISSRE